MHPHPGRRCACWLHALKRSFLLPTQDGFEFWLALNGVLLCEGPLPASYVQRIERARLPADW